MKQRLPHYAVFVRGSPKACSLSSFWLSLCCFCVPDRYSVNFRFHSLTHVSQHHAHGVRFRESSENERIRKRRRRRDEGADQQHWRRWIRAAVEAGSSQQPRPLPHRRDVRLQDQRDWHGAAQEATVDSRVPPVGGRHGLRAQPSRSLPGRRSARQRGLQQRGGGPGGAIRRRVSSRRIGTLGDSEPLHGALLGRKRRSRDLSRKAGFRRRVVDAPLSLPAAGTNSRMRKSTADDYKIVHQVLPTYRKNIT